MNSSTKEWIQYGSAIFMILSGTVLSFISFFTQGTVVGGVLIGVAALAAIPVYTRHAKAKKDARLRDVEKKLKKWLESLRMGPSIHLLLSKQNEALFEKLEKAQQKVAEELLDKKNVCEKVKRSLVEMADSLKIQFANVK